MVNVVSIALKLDYFGVHFEVFEANRAHNRYRPFFLVKIGSQLAIFEFSLRYPLVKPSKQIILIVWIILLLKWRGLEGLIISELSKED